MKTKKFAFLFFCALFLLMQNLYSRQTNDSLKYYIALIKKPKGVSSLIEAYSYLQKDKRTSLLKNQYIRAAYELSHISIVEFNLGAYYNSENSAIEGLVLLDSLSNNKLTIPYRIALLNNLGKIKRHFKDYKKSLEYYHKMLDLSFSNNDKGIAHNNIGVVYMYDKKYKLALDEFQKGYIHNNKTKYDEETIRSLDNLGFVQSKLNIIDGLPNMMKVLEIRLKNKNSSVFASYKHLVEYYSDRKNIKQALFYANRAYNFSKAFNSSPMLEQALLSLITLGEFQYANEYSDVVEKRKSEGLKAANEFAAAKYDYTKEQHKRKEAELREAKTNFQNLLFLLGIILVVLVSGFVFYILRTRHKKEKLKTRFDTERQISKKLHDEVANDAFSLMSKMQSDPNTQKELIDNLEQIYLKTRDISKANAALDVSQNFDDLLKDLIAGYKTKNVNIFTRNISEISWNSIENLKKETLYRVIQELMTNMKKHSNASMVTLQFKKIKNKAVITYVDNGVGCKLKYGNGLRNTENRMEMAGCTIIFESEINKGFQATLTI
mgnify:CR=1 FL=1